MENKLQVIKEKFTKLTNKVSNAPTKFKKVMWILAIIGIVALLSIPFIIYVMFFGKKDTTDVYVEVEVEDIENNVDVNMDDVESATKKGQEALDKIKEIRENRE